MPQKERKLILIVTESAVGTGWAEWLNTFNLNIFGSFTFNPISSKSWTHKNAFGRFVRFMRDIKCKQWFVVDESKRYGGNVHLHALIKTNLKLSIIGGGWKHGSSKIEIATEGAAGYCSKYLFSDSEFMFASTMKNIRIKEVN